MTDNERERMDPQVRRALIVEAAHDVACRDGNLRDVTHESTAEACAVTTSVATVRWYFRTIGDLRLAVMQRDAGFHEQAKRLGLLG